MAASLTLVINDPQTIKLLLKYRTFLEQEDGLQGTLNEVAAGLVVGCLDENLRFTRWTREHAAVLQQPASAGATEAIQGDNVLPLSRTTKQLANRRTASA